MIKKIPTVAIIFLKYEEEEYQSKMESCLNDFTLWHEKHHNQAFVYQIFDADRDGVGNMSRAFNDAFIRNCVVNSRKLQAIGKVATWIYDEINFDYVWFVTNIKFSPAIPGKLIQALEEDPELAAIHPAFHSDHGFLCPRNSDAVQEVPFVELTAPMFRVADFFQFMLCEETPYYYMDLIISHQLKQAGKKLAVHHGATIDHVYLRNTKSQHPISRIREQLRHYWTPRSREYMLNTFGPNWENELWKKHYNYKG